MTFGSSVDSRHPDVRALAQFVATRVAEDRQVAACETRPDEILTDLCNMTDCLLDRIRNSICVSGRAISTLAQVALIYSEHPDFRPRWFTLSRVCDESETRRSSGVLAYQS